MRQRLEWALGLLVLSFLPLSPPQAVSCRMDRPCVQLTEQERPASDLHLDPHGVLASAAPHTGSGPWKIAGGKPGGTSGGPLQVERASRALIRMRPCL